MTERLNLPRTVHEIAWSATRTLTRGPSRRCKLRDRNVVMRLLVAFQSGFSQASAARAAGVTEQVVRLWLKLGAQPDGAEPYVLFRQAVDAIRAERAPKPPPPVIHFVAAHPSVPAPPPPPPPRPRMTPERISNLSAEMHRIREQMIPLECRPEHRQRLERWEQQHLDSLSARLREIHAEISSATV